MMVWLCLFKKNAYILIGISLQMKGISNICFKKLLGGPGQVSQLVGVLSKHPKVAGLVSGQGTYRKQPMAKISGTINQCFSLSVTVSLSL